MCRTGSTGESRENRDFAGTRKWPGKKFSVPGGFQYGRKAEKQRFRPYAEVAGKEIFSAWGFSVRAKSGKTEISPVRSAGGGRKSKCPRAGSTGEKRKNRDFAGTRKWPGKKFSVPGGFQYGRKAKKQRFRLYEVRAEKEDQIRALPLCSARLDKCSKNCIIASYHLKNNSDSSSSFQGVSAENTYLSAGSAVTPCAGCGAANPGGENRRGGLRTLAVSLENTGLSACWARAARAA